MLNQLESNTPSNIFYSAFEAEILRSARKTNDATIFQKYLNFSQSNDKTRR